jgi:hypothetical protein
MTNYNSFDEWFNKNSVRYFNDAKCPDPFKKQEILKEWLKNAWKSGYNSSITETNENRYK